MIRYILANSLILNEINNAEVAELVDARDLKSLVGNHVPVQVRSSVPFRINELRNIPKAISTHAYFS